MSYTPDFSFAISPSVEMDRLQIVFADAAAQAGIELHRVQNVGGRRDATNATTHYVFPPHREASVRAHIAAAEARFAAQAAAQPAMQTALNALLAAQDVKLAAAVDKAAQRDADLDAYAKAHPVPVVFGKFCASSFVENNFVTFPYAAGAPSRLKACGAHWDERNKRWVFGTHRLAEIHALVHELRRLVAAQQIKDAKKKAKLPAVRRNRALVERHEQMLAEFLPVTLEPSEYSDEEMWEDFHRRYRPKFDAPDH